MVKFDGDLLPSDGVVLSLLEVEQRLQAADRLAAGMIDPRAADLITGSLSVVIHFQLPMISAGNEDGNDANSPRRDAMPKMEPLQLRLFNAHNDEYGADRRARR